MRKILTVMLLMACNKTPAVTCGSGTRLVNETCLSSPSGDTKSVKPAADDSDGVGMATVDMPLFCSPFSGDICAPTRAVCEFNHKTCAPYSLAFCFQQTRNDDGGKGLMCTPDLKDCQALLDRFQGRADVTTDKFCAATTDRYEYGVGGNVK